MKLFNKTIDRQLFKQYPLGSDLSKQEVVVKIFNPQGRGNWFILNSDPEDPDYLWAIVDLGYGAEVGSVSRSDLENYRGRFGLGFERDLSFDPINAEELYKGLRKGKYYTDGGNLSRDRKFLNHSEDYEVRYSKDTNRKGYGFERGGQLSGDEVTLLKGYGYYDLSKYAYGNDFKRFVESVNGKFIKGTVKLGGQIRVLLNDGREIITDIQAIDLPTYNEKNELYQQNKHLFSFGFADGGDIENLSDNQRMIMNQNVEVEHHHEELEDILEDKVPVPAWVVAKMETATQNLSDITHYLDGQKEIMEDQLEGEDDDEDKIENKEVVEPINVSAGTKAELTKNFTDDAWGNLRGFLKGMEGIDLRDDYTFDYRDEQFEVEPIINSDENGVSNAVFSIFDGDGEEVGEVAYSREGGKQKFTANSMFFQWNNAKFEDGGFMSGVYAYGGSFKNETEIFKDLGDMYVVNLWKGQWTPISRHKFKVDAEEISKMVEKGSSPEEVRLKIKEQSKNGLSEYVAKQIGNKFEDGGGVDDYFNKMRRGEGYRYDTIYLPKDLKEEVENFIKQGYNELIDDGKGKLYLLNKDSEIGKSFEASEKEEIQAIIENFGKQKDSFADGGYFDGAIPKTSSYMSTYAKGGEIAKAEILGLSKNILGTTSIEMKITGMRKSQDFSVYPIGKDDSKEIITIQSETRIGKIDLSSGRGLMSQSHSNGAYFVHFQMDKLTPFTVSESDLEELKMHIFKTAGDNVGSRGIVSDNSGASRIFADGGFMNDVYAKGGSFKNKGYNLKDINGKKIEVGDTVKTTQPSGGLLNPANPEVGIVEKTKDAFGNDDLQIRYRKQGTNYDRFILLNGKINEIVKKSDSFEDGGFMNGVYAKGGRFEDFDGIAYAKTKGRESVDWDKEFREYVGSEYSKLTQREKEEIISDMQRDWDRSYSYANGGSLEDKLTKLQNKKSELESRLFDAQQKSNAVMNNIGFGAGMRRSKVSFSTSREDSLKERIKVVEKEIKQTKQDLLPKKPKYILKADIKTVTVKRNGKEVAYKGADVLNGANVLAKGGDITSKANYIPKRDVVEVELKDGSKVKPVNGYWVKKGAEPILSKQIFTYEDLPKDGSAININAPAMSGAPAIDLVLKYDSKNFRFDVYKDGVKKDVIGEKEVLNNLNSGIYVFTDKLTPTSSSKFISDKEKEIDNKLAFFTSNDKEFNSLQNKYNEQIIYFQKLEKERLKLIKKGVFDTEQIETKIKEAKVKANLYFDKSMDLLKKYQNELTQPKNSSSSKSEPKISETYIRKDARGNWRAETNIDNFNDYDWRLSTIKTYSGNLVSSAQGGKTEATGTKGIVMFKYAMYQDPNYTLEVSKPKRLTDKVVTEQHDKALAKFKKFMETGMFKGGGKISNFDKLSAKVAEQYEGKPVKSKYQEEYGKYYSKEEAQEVGDKVAGKVKAMQTDSKAFGGLFGEDKSTTKKPKYPELEGKEVVLKSGKYVRVFSQSGSNLTVLDLGKIGTGERPYKIEISEVEIDSFKAGGDVSDKRVNSGTETLKRANELAKEIRKDGESWLDAKKRAFAQLKKT